MTTTKKNEVKIQYPFITKKQLAAQIAGDDVFALRCLTIMQSRTDARVAGQKSSGWMSSHSKRAKAAVENPSDLVEVRALVSSYTKQLAAHFRAEAISANPDLQDVATLFSAD